MHLIKSSVGRKLLMAVSGQLMILFVIIHVIGNSMVYFGRLNAYAAELHSLPVLVWISRLGLAAAFLFHLYLGTGLTLENYKAKKEGYAVSKSLQTTFAAKNMIWSGAVIGVFLIYHLLQFTFQVISPATSAHLHMDALGRPDVTSMVIAGFQNFSIVLVYIVAMTALVFHLTHGIQSSIQTLGLNNDRTFPVIRTTGSAAAFILYLGYVSIPVIIFLFMVKG
jgi:succinate dehydrogenase / fumarate reductase cytochrome b subunit